MEVAIYEQLSARFATYVVDAVVDARLAEEQMRANSARWFHSLPFLVQLPMVIGAALMLSWFTRRLWGLISTRWT